MKCNTCGSENLRSVRQLYQAGTSGLVGSSRSDGQVFTSTGATASWAATATVSGTAQTSLAKRLAPPAKKRSAFAMFLIVIGAYLVFVPFLIQKFEFLWSFQGILLPGFIEQLAFTLYSTTHIWLFHSTGFAGIVFMLLSVPIFLLARSYNRKTWMPALINWHNSYLCERCDRISVLNP